MLVVKRNDADDYYIQNCHLPQAEKIILTNIYI